PPLLRLRCRRANCPSLRSWPRRPRWRTGCRPWGAAAGGRPGSARPARQRGRPPSRSGWWRSSGEAQRPGGAEGPVASGSWKASAFVYLLCGAYIPSARELILPIGAKVETRVHAFRCGEQQLRFLRLVGKRWTLAILAALMHGPARFSELARAVPG